ncbi:MAG TPA: GMC family oxidoreductase [Gaiellaceae bacterium]|nr:GMC family oxidoreductase [Gaiellaceae bacterium]
MSVKLKKTDVVIVGLGAAGGYASLTLARAGLDVVGLEAGPRWKPQDFPMDELRNDVRNVMSQPKAAKEVPTWRPNPSVKATQTGGIRILMMNGVGGSSIHYGMEQWRYLPWNFRTRSETIKRYGASMIPAGSTVVDWPIGYEDLEPYYDKVEYDMGVSGKAGNLKGKKVPGGNVFEAPRTREYPLPPLRRSGWNELTAAAAKRLGWHPFPGPAAIRSRAYNGLPACQYCGFCTFNGCMAEAKGSTDVGPIARAEKTGHLKVVPLARVTKIEVGKDGRASGVTYVKGRKSYFQPASVVVLATYVYENTRLLLLSKSKAFPNGLSNNHGQVGKHYISHMYGGANGLFPGKQLNRFSGPGAQRTSVDDWNADNFDHKGLGFIGGGVIDSRMENKPISAARSTPPSVPRFGSAWKEWLHKNANSVGDAGAQIESLPYEDNFADLDPEVRDAFGLPVLRVTFDLHDQEKARHAFVTAKAEQLLKEAGASETWPQFPAVPIAVNSHAYGTTRMGDDPETSVVDKWLMSHEVPNLAILGGSTFPTSTAYNPTHTIEALAWRTGDHIVKSWKAIVA